MSNTNPRTELATIHEVTAIDRQQMTALAEQLLPKWPKDLNRQTALDVARVALAYQLDPFMEELIPYQGKPYVTIAGRIRIADNHPMFDGYDLEPATEAEHRALGAHEGEAVWKCVVYRKDRSRPTKAFGRAGGPAEQNPVARRWLPEIAQKRAMHRALRAAFPLNLPGVEERSSAAQLRAIHAADAEAGIDREARHQALTETFGVDSSDELTSAQAGAYLDERVVDSHTEIEVAYEPSMQDEVEVIDLHAEIRDILDALRTVDDRRDLTALKARIRAAGLESDDEVTGAYNAAYNRLRGKQDAADAGQGALPV
jgi:hypothetical protein